MNRVTANEQAWSHQSSPKHVGEEQPGAPRPKRIRSLRRLLGGLATFWLVASPLHAGELTAMSGESIDLGGFHGVVYYTAEDDDYRVVATIANGETGLPMRFSATLADNQSVKISVPGKAGERDHSLQISRSGDKLYLGEAERISTVVTNSEMLAIAQ